MQELTGRHELKHPINYADLISLRSRLAAIMRRDEHCLENGNYQIRSLYFDNYADKVLLEKINGVDDREKFRLRFYNSDTAFIRLEKKSKSGGLYYKHSAAIPLTICEEVVNGKFSSLKKLDDGLFQEFYAKLQYQLLRPRTIVEYERTAFKMDAGNVRVTLDRGIQTSNQANAFLSGEFVGFPLPGVCILEVKYDHFLPELVRTAAALNSRQTAAFSKYSYSRLNQE